MTPTMFCSARRDMVLPTLCNLGHQVKLLPIMQVKCQGFVCRTCNCWYIIDTVDPERGFVQVQTLLNRLQQNPVVMDWQTHLMFLKLALVTLHHKNNFTCNMLLDINHHYQS